MVRNFKRRPSWKCRICSTQSVSALGNAFHSGRAHRTDHPCGAHEAPEEPRPIIPGSKDGSHDQGRERDGQDRAQSVDKRYPAVAHRRVEEIAENSRLRTIDRSPQDAQRDDDAGRNDQGATGILHQPERRKGGEAVEQ